MNSVGGKQNGFILITTLILTGVLVTIGAALLTMVNQNYADAGFQRDEAQAIYLAETAVEEAVWYLKNVDVAWTGDAPTEHTLNTGSYTISVDQGGAPTVVITGIGYVPNKANARVQKTLEVTGNLL